MTLSLKLAPHVAFSVCQLPPVYLFNCFGCFFPFPLGLCLPGLSAGSPQSRSPGMPSLSSPFAPQLRAWVRSALGMAALPCAWSHGVRPCLKPAGLLRSGHSAVSTSPPNTRGHGRRQSLGRATPSICKPCPAPREPTDLAGESAGPETANPAVRRDATSLSNNRICVVGMRVGCGRRKALCCTGEIQNASQTPATL